MIEMCKDVTLHPCMVQLTGLLSFKLLEMLMLCHCACLFDATYKYTSFPQDGGSLLIPAVQSGSLALFDLMVDRFKLSPHQWSEVGYQ